MPATCCRCWAAPGAPPARGSWATCSWTPASRRPARPAGWTCCAPSCRTQPADEFAGLLAAGGSFPDWSDDDLRELVPADGPRATLVGSLRPRGAGFFAEPVPVAPDWPDAPCGLLRLSDSYDGAARLAGLRGWPVLLGPDDRPGGHFAMLVDPESVADDLETLVSRL